MISKDALAQSIRQANKSVRARERERDAAQSQLTQAERELTLLVELAQLRGWEHDELAAMASERFTDVGATRPVGKTRTRAESPKRAALLAAVMDVLASRGKPVHIGELMTALQERGVEIPGSGQQANVIAHISRDERIVRPKRGFYALSEWGLSNGAAPKRGRAARGGGRPKGRT